MMIHVTAAALVSEAKSNSFPASVDSIPTDGNKEDQVPMAMGAAWKLRRIVGNVRNILAIELMCAAHDYELDLALAREQHAHLPVGLERELGHVASQLGADDFAR